MYTVPLAISRLCLAGVLSISIVRIVLFVFVKYYRKLLTLATTESVFLFNDNYYKQIDGVAMGSPLGSTLANAFMCHYERKWLDDCPSEFKPTFYRRYVDDIFVTFSSPSHVEPFFSYLNSRHGNISFTHEKEKDIT